MLPKTIVTTLTAVPRSCGDLELVAVVDRALAHPRVEDGLDRQLELLAGRRSGTAAGLALDELLELAA